MWGLKRHDRWIINDFTGNVKEFPTIAAAESYANLSWPGELRRSVVVNRVNQKEK